MVMRALVSCQGTYVTTRMAIIHYNKVGIPTLAGSEYQNITCINHRIVFPVTVIVVCLLFPVPYVSHRFSMMLSIGLNTKLEPQKLDDICEHSLYGPTLNVSIV